MGGVYLAQPCRGAPLAGQITQITEMLTKLSETVQRLDSKLSSGSAATRTRGLVYRSVAGASGSCCVACDFLKEDSIRL